MMENIFFNPDMHEKCEVRDKQERRYAWAPRLTVKSIKNKKVNI